MCPWGSGCMGRFWSDHACQHRGSHRWKVVQQAALDALQSTCDLTTLI